LLYGLSARNQHVFLGRENSEMFSQSLKLITFLSGEQKLFKEKAAYSINLIDGMAWQKAASVIIKFPIFS